MRTYTYIYIYIYLYIYIRIDLQLYPTRTNLNPKLQEVKGCKVRFTVLELRGRL